MKIRINFRGQKQQEPGDRIPVDGEKTEDKARTPPFQTKRGKSRHGADSDLTDCYVASGEPNHESRGTPQEKTLEEPTAQTR
jgi:hypothetical protein